MIFTVQLYSYVTIKHIGHLADQWIIYVAIMLPWGWDMYSDFNLFKYIAIIVNVCIATNIEGMVSNHANDVIL